jgi:hypothetical protein
MAVSAHLFPQADQGMASKTLELATDALFVLLIATGTFTWGATPYGYSTVSQFLAGDGTNGAVTEESTSGTAYARQALTSIVLSTTALVTTLTCANPAWATATISAKYAVWYDGGAGGSGASANDATTNKLLCYWDFGGAQASSAGTFTLQVNASGLLTFTAS